MELNASWIFPPWLGYEVISTFVLIDVQIISLIFVIYGVAVDADLEVVGIRHELVPQERKRALDVSRDTTGFLRQCIRGGRSGEYPIDYHCSFVTDLLISQDDHRIIIFDKSAVENLGLPDRLSPKLRANLGTKLTTFTEKLFHPTEPHPVPVTTNDFLHQHFLWCLRIHFLGGDVEETYTSEMVESVSEAWERHVETGEDMDVELPEDLTEEDKKNWRLLEQFFVANFD